MRIVAVEPIPIAYSDPNGPNPDPADRTAAFILLVRITTDDGLVGWGETWTRFSEANRATYEIVTAMAELLVGADASEVEALHARLAQRMYWYGEGGIGWLALSAIDIALWDLRCRAAGLPLIEVLGGARQASMPVVTSTHPHGAEIAEMVEDAVSTVTGRTAGYKFGMVAGSPGRLGLDHDRDVAFIRSLREALGPQALIVADARAPVNWDLDTAARRAAAFEPYDLAWLEEPLQPWDREGYRQLKALTPMRVGYGEREWTTAGYQRVIDDGQSDVIGIDPGRVGGVTALLKVVAAIPEGRYWHSHSWSGAILSAVGLAVSCASGKALMFEIKPIPDAMQTELVQEPVWREGLTLAPPTRPGIGVDVIEQVVDRFRTDR